MDWEKRELDADYLIDSGLLYEINRTIMHLFGLRLAIVNETKQVHIIDDRDDPTCLFAESTNVAGAKKLAKFLSEFGSKQIQKRREKLGFATQHKPV